MRNWPITKFGVSIGKAGFVYSACNFLGHWKRHKFEDAMLLICFLQPYSSAGAGDLIHTHRQMSEPPKSPSRCVAQKLG